MALFKTDKIRPLLFAAVIATTSIVAGVVFVADLRAGESASSASPNPQQAQAMANLVAPPAPLSHGVTGQDPAQDTTAAQIVANDCVAQLDDYIEPIFITFDMGDSLISADNAPLLSHIAALIASCPDAHVMVAGHADGSGNDQTNLALSWARADETLNLLVTLGADPASLESVGFGARAPMAQGSDDEDGANRRVDFRVLRRRD